MRLIFHDSGLIADVNCLLLKIWEEIIDSSLAVCQQRKQVINVMRMATTTNNKKRKRNVLAVEQKLEICDSVRRGVTYKEIARTYNMYRKVYHFGHYEKLTATPSI